jgi:hypothetical protein
VRLLTRAVDVFAPTLTGLCERPRVLTPAIDLDTHILDIVNELKWQELRDVVIVNHSYGGIVISGVAEKMEKAIASFVMLDAFMPENAQLVVNIWPAAMRDGLLAAERGGATTSRRGFQGQRKGPRLGRCAMQTAADQMFPAKLTLSGACQRIGDWRRDPLFRCRLGQRAAEGVAHLRGPVRPRRHA